MQKTNSKGVKWLKRVAKILLWIVGSIIFLLLAVVFLLRLESVQNFIISKATKFVSDKTHTTVKIGHIRISYPAEIILEKVFLDDTNRDTLLYAGSIGINAYLPGLLSNKLNISSINIENLKANIARDKDSIFNFNFFIEAFSGKKDTLVKVADTLSKPMEINLSEISLKSLTLSYNDNISGVSMKSGIGELSLNFDDFDLSKNIFHSDKLTVSNSFFSIFNSRIPTQSNDTSTSPLPDVSVNLLTLNNVNFASGNTVTREKLRMVIGTCRIKADKINLPGSKADIESLILTNSICEIDSRQKKGTATKDNSGSIAWQITAKDLDLQSVSFMMNDLDKPVLQGSFDPSHIDVSNFNGHISDLSFLPQNITASINALSLDERSGFRLKNLKTGFVFNQHAIELNNLDLVTSNSRIRNNLSIGFTSLENISGSIGEMIVNASLHDSHIGTKDILLFQPDSYQKSCF